MLEEKTERNSLLAQMWTTDILWSWLPTYLKKSESKMSVLVWFRLIEILALLFCIHYCAQKPDVTIRPRPRYGTDIILKSSEISESRKYIRPNPIRQWISMVDTRYASFMWKVKVKYNDNQISISCERGPFESSVNTKKNLYFSKIIVAMLLRDDDDEEVNGVS